jgi:hypothetical protein
MHLLSPKDYLHDLEAYFYEATKCVTYGFVSGFTMILILQLTLQLSFVQSVANQQRTAITAPIILVLKQL